MERERKLLLPSPQRCGRERRLGRKKDELVKKKRRKVYSSSLSVLLDSLNSIVGIGFWKEKVAEAEGSAGYSSSQGAFKVRTLLTGIWG